MTTAILTDERHVAHTDPTHVERAERLVAINEALDDSGLRSSLLALPPIAPPESVLEAVHSPRLIAGLRRTAEMGGGRIDADTYLTGESWEAATLAAGAAVQAVAAVVGGETSNAFALMRPPGHHATPMRSMGFCLLNNVAIAARYALDEFGLKRVAIVDYDVHHGNGTQDAFYTDGRVLFCSSHAAMIYPGTGGFEEQGNGEGRGTTLNMPLPHGVGDRGYARLYEEVVVPALRRFQPELILVSAGFDAHWSDPLGTEILSAEGYARLTRILYDAAAELCDGQLVLTLEGGYNLEALGACVVAACEVLLGRRPRPDAVGAVTARETDIDSLIAAFKQRHPLLRHQS